MNLKPFDNPVYFTRPYLPPAEDFCTNLSPIWVSRQLSNSGPLLRRLEGELSRYFRNPNISLFANGSLALQLGIQALGLKGEVITTPFTYAATANVIELNGLQPVFCDIEPHHFNIDPSKIPSLISDKTCAVLGVHTFGYPCDIPALEEVVQQYGLKLIFDAAHAFGVTIDGVPLVRFGDMSMLSFHATKPFHTFEGGALFFRDESLKTCLDQLSNNGLDSEGDVLLPGTNAKMNEFQAAVGLSLLPHMDWVLSERKRVEAAYRKWLDDVPGLEFRPALPAGIVDNVSFLPVRIEPGEFGASRDELLVHLKSYNVIARRYFYPLLSDTHFYRKRARRGDLGVANSVAAEVLILPVFPELQNTDVERICAMIRQLQQRY